MGERIEFRLRMPRRSSSNGSWSGEGRNYVIVRTVPDNQVTELLASDPWFHRWDDGWVAEITARQMGPGERRAKSDGFCGYDWMVDNIISYGSPYRTGTADGMSPAFLR